MSVPAWPMPTQNTKFVMSHAQPTGTLRPQMPIPSQNSHETATPRRPRSAREGMKKSHQPIGVGRSTGSATTSVMEWKSGERRISVGRPATGLSSSSASVWAKPLFPASTVESCCLLSSCIAGSQARESRKDPLSRPRGGRSAPDRRRARYDSARVIGLRPSLTPLNAIAMVAGTIIGASIFVQPSEIARHLDTPGRDHARLGRLRRAHAVRRVRLRGAGVGVPADRRRLRLPARHVLAARGLPLGLGDVLEHALRDHRGHRGRVRALRRVLRARRRRGHPRDRGRR